MSLPATAEYIGRLTGQSKPSVSTVWRWCLKGCKGVLLESVCIGGKRFVTVGAIERFITVRSEMASDRLPDAVHAEQTTAPRAEPRVERRREEIEAARRCLDRLTGGDRHRSQAPPSAN